jgi:predicted CxxxxCH...CXXCH cytochrome family protein
MDHRDGKIRIRQHINSTASVRGIYSKSTFFNQTSVSNPGTCSSVNCHFRTTTPVWGSAALSGGQTVANCAICHQSTGMVSGNHTKHITALGGTVTTCANCHPNNTTFTHATSAKAGGAISVSFSGAPKGTGSYTVGNHKNYPNYLDGTGTYGSCNTTYCHGTTGPAWNSGALTCAQCHDAVTPGLTLRHDKHVSAVIPTVLTGGVDSHTNSAYAYACLNCHPTNQHATGAASAVAPLQDAAVTGTKVTAYVKGSVAAVDAKGFNYTTNGTCTTVCHTRDGVTAGTAIVAQNWGTTPVATCGVCHSKAGDAAPTWTTPHTKHINTYAANTNISCSSCHTGTAANNTTIQATVAARNQHPNGNRDLAMDTFATGGTVTIAGAQGAQTCSNTYCHSNGTIAAGTHAAVSWSGTFSTCAECHGNTASLTTGAHSKHLSLSGVTCSYCHNATASNSTTISSYTNHINKNATINFNASAAPAGGTYNAVLAGGASVYQKPVGTAAGVCATTTCHGSNSGVWNVANTNDTCTKCHGTATATGIISAAANNRYLVAPPVNTAGLTGTLTGTSQVSNDTKVGAHQTHLQSALNAFSNYSTVDYRCQGCHGPLPATGNHANGSSVPAFEGMATRGGRVPTWTASSFTCSNTYCHNPAGTTLNAGNIGTRVFVSWTSSSYLGDTVKSEANCNRCHKSPGAVAGTILLSGTNNHASVKISDTCAGCHGHNGDATGTIGKRHIDGIKYGSGDCDSCHGYQAGSWDTATAINPEGKGAHEAHIVYLTTKRNTITLAKATDQYAGATTAWTGVCGVCHGNTVTNHQNSAVNVALDTNYFFGPGTGTPTYQGSPGVSSATTAKTCSNISCHYFTTPIWSTY